MHDMTARLTPPGENVNGQSNSTLPTPGTIDFGPLELSERFGELMHALAGAQYLMHNPENDTRNYYGSRYASMPSVRNAAVPALTSQGIAILQCPEYDYAHGIAGCVTMLCYGEQYIRATVRTRVVETVNEYIDNKKVTRLLEVDEIGHQKYTAVFSYLRRIALKALVGLADEEDDDDERGKDKGEDHKTAQISQRDASRERLSRTRHTPPSADDAAPGDTERQALLKEIWTLYKEAIQPLKHVGMHKAIFFHSFRLEKPEQITEQSLETLEAGMLLYRHLTAQVLTWDRGVKPDDWIGQQQHILAGKVEETVPIPEHLNLDTGELVDEMPEGWLTKDELAAQHARDEAVLLQQAEQG